MVTTRAGTKSLARAQLALNAATTKKKTRRDIRIPLTEEEQETLMKLFREEQKKTADEEVRDLLNLLLEAAEHRMKEIKTAEEVVTKKAADKKHKEEESDRLRDELFEQQRRLEEGKRDGLLRDPQETPGLCKACFERPVRLVMNCHHGVCEPCRTESFTCPVCNRSLFHTRPIFL